MGNIYEMVRNEARNAIAKECHEDSPTLKPVTVRIPEHYIKLADKIAANCNETRQGLLYFILTSGINEALDGYVSVFENSQQVADQLFLESGFPAFSEPESAE